MRTLIEMFLLFSIMVMGFDLYHLESAVDRLEAFRKTQDKFNSELIGIENKNVQLINQIVKNIDVMAEFSHKRTTE